MAVAWVSTITPWGGISFTETSGNFIPTAGNALVVFNWAPFSGFTAGTPGFSGTGTYTTLTNVLDLSSDAYASAHHLNCSGGSQSITVSWSGSPGGTGGWAFQYSGVAQTPTGATNETDSPGVGTGAILGVSVNVPTGSILLALCIDFTGQTAVPSSPSGTNRGSGGSTIGSSIGAYCVTEYAGAGVNIQPSFTAGIGTSTDSYFVIQMLLQPAAAAVGPGGEYCFVM
jgi:hypothetical protein